MGHRTKRNGLFLPFIAERSNSCCAFCANLVKKHTVTYPLHIAAGLVSQQFSPLPLEIILAFVLVERWPWQQLRKGLCSLAMFRPKCDKLVGTRNKLSLNLQLSKENSSGHNRHRGQHGEIARCTKVTGVVDPEATISASPALVTPRSPGPCLGRE